MNKHFTEDTRIIKFNLSSRSNAKLSGHLQSSIWRCEKRPCNNRTCPRDALGNSSHRKPKETLRPSLNKIKVDPFKNVLNFSSKIFFRSDFKQLNKNATFLPTPRTIQETYFKQRSTLFLYKRHTESLFWIF